MTNRFIDNLKRAYEMEERMANVLIDLCEPAIIEADASDASAAKIRKFLLSIQKDTLRHKEIVQNLLEKFSKEASHG